MRLPGSTRLPTTADPRSAVVTGAARGIGRAMAARLVRDGYHVVITDIDSDEVVRTAADIGAVEGIVHDVTDEGGHTEIANRASAHAPLGVWVNNAGVGFDGNLADQPSADVRTLVDVNFLAVIWGTRAAIAALRVHGRGGDIIITSSLSAHGPVPGLSVYAATKAAVLSLASSIASELKGERIRVHAVCPDGVDTRLVADLTQGSRASALIHSGGRLLTTAEVADATIDMVGRRRVYRTVPAHRGVMLQLTQAAPSLFMPLEPLLRRQGARAARKIGH